MTTRHRRDAVRAGLSAGDTAVSVAVVQLKCMAAAKCSLRDCTMHFQSPGLTAGLTTDRAPAGLIALFVVSAAASLCHARGR